MLVCYVYHESLLIVDPTRNAHMDGGVAPEHGGRRVVFTILCCVVNT